MNKKNVVGDQVAPFANLRNRRKSRERHNSRSCHLKQSSKPQDQNPKIKHDQGQTAMGRRNGKAEFKYNLDCFSDSELDSESDEEE